MRTLIAGGGQVGTLIARRLIREGNEVTIVDPSPERCAQLEAALDAKVVEGSAASVVTMKRAGIADAEMLIAVTDIDEINMLACLIAQVESKARIKVARLRTHEVDQWRRISEAAGLGIDLIIHPETEIAERIMRVLRVPGVSDLLSFADGHVQLFGMNVEPDSWMVGKTLLDLQQRRPPENSLIAMIFRGPQVIIPHGAEVLRQGDHIYVVGTEANLGELREFMGLEQPQELSRVFVLGGKQIGILVAEQLERQGVQVKLFEKDARRSARIAEILKKTIVIHGDGTDQGTLEEENIEGVDAFLALTSDDEDNIIASLLARRLGVKKVVALINRLNYLPMAQRARRQHDREPAAGRGRPHPAVRPQGARALGHDLPRGGGGGDRADRDRGHEVRRQARCVTSASLAGPSSARSCGPTARRSCPAARPRSRRAIG